MDPLNNCPHDNKHNILIFLVACLVILQAVTCVFSYKIKENSYIATNKALGYTHAGNPDEAPVR
jgi:hypothetical protein